MITFLGLVFTIREYERQTVLNIYVMYNNKYQHVVEKLPAEVFIDDFTTDKYRELLQNSRDPSSATTKATLPNLEELDQVMIDYFDLCNEQFSIMNIGGGYMVRKQWLKMVYTWIRGTWETMNHDMFTDAFKRTCEKDTSEVEAEGTLESRYPPEFIDYMFDFVIDRTSPPDLSEVKAIVKCAKGNGISNLEDGIPLP